MELLLDQCLWAQVSWTVGAAATLLMAGNALGVLLVAMQLPGTWLMLGLTSLVAWWQWDQQMISIWVLVVMGLLAVVGELVELAGSAAGAMKVKSSKRAVLGAIVGGVAGAIVGTMVLPVPIVGTVLGACAGAAVGAMAGDLWAGRDWRQASISAKGAAWGKLLGTVAKLGVAGVMWIVAATAALAP